MSDLSNCECRHLLEIGERFRASLSEIQKNEESIRSQGVLAVESAERIATRKSLLGGYDEEIALERVLGESDFLSANYFSIGETAARAVCRIHILDDRGRPRGYGTGFLVAPSLILTNWHVLEDVSLAKRSYVEFDYELDEDNFPRVSCIYPMSVATFFHANRALDFALVALEGVSRDGKSLAEYPPLRLIEQSGKALLHENVTIVQHPLGSHKQVALRNSKILNYHENVFVHYSTDTEPGSSGSPVLNDQMEVVALHHAGVPKTDGQHVLKVDGTPFQVGDEPDQIDWVANEGIRISSIFKYLRAKSDWKKHEILYLEEQLGIDLDDETGGSVLVPPNNLSPITGGEMPFEKIKASELLDRVYEDDITEEEMERYFVLSEESLGMAPIFEPNPTLVEDDLVGSEESAQMLNIVNWWCKRKRQKRYRKHIRKYPNATRIVSEGDSWFQYPIKLHDVIDHLMDEKDFAILSFGEAGDLISNMVAKAEFMSALDREKPDYFLISGAGNDLVGNEGLRQYVRNVNSQKPQDYIVEDRFKMFTDRITQNYRRLLSMVLSVRPNIKILSHGYSYAIPNSGKWLGKPLEKEGIHDREMQRRIVKLIMERVAQAIQSAIFQYPTNGTFLNLLEKVPAHGWYDELHPKSKYFGEIAESFKKQIRG